MSEPPQYMQDDPVEDSDPTVPYLYTDDVDDEPQPAIYRIDLRFWLRLIAYGFLALLLLLAAILSIALAAMGLRYIGREPAPRPPATTTTVEEPTVRTVPPTTIKPAG